MALWGERSDLVLEGEGWERPIGKGGSMGNVEKGGNEDLKAASSQDLGMFSIVPSNHLW